MPVVVIDAMEVGPPELGRMLPLRAELRRVVPGPDRPDYCLAQLERIVPYRPAEPATFDWRRTSPDFVRRDEAGTLVVAVYAVVMAARFAGTRIGPNMRDLWVGLAYVIDNSLPADRSFDPGKADYVAVVRINVDRTTDHLFPG